MNGWIGFVVLGGLGQCLIWFSSFYKHPSFCFRIGSVMWARRKLDTISFPSLYHVSWNMLLLPSKRVRSDEPAVFHGTFVDPHSSVLVIASRVTCTPSLLAAHTPSRCPLHSSHLEVTFRWGLFLPCGSRRKGCGDGTGSQLCGCQSVLSPHPHLHLYFSDLIPFLRVTYSPPRPRPGAWISFSLKSKNFALKCLTVGHFPQLLLGFWA